MSALFRPTRTEVQAVQRLARLTEAHAVEADLCEQAKRPGAWLAHDGIARDYAKQAFALSHAVQERCA